MKYKALVICLSWLAVNDIILKDIIKCFSKGQTQSALTAKNSTAPRAKQNRSQAFQNENVGVLTRLSQWERAVEWRAKLKNEENRWRTQPFNLTYTVFGNFSMFVRLKTIYLKEDTQRADQLPTIRVKRRT